MPPRHFTNIGAPEMPNIHHELLIGAPAETVYAAITTQEGLSGWWTPDAKTTAELNSIARFLSVRTISRK
jgi:uncharacterized protein YndB with AHSA1/START domain